MRLSGGCMQPKEASEMKKKSEKCDDDGDDDNVDDAGQKEKKIIHFFLFLHKEETKKTRRALEKSKKTKAKRNQTLNYSPRPSTLILAARGAPALARRCIALSLPSTLDVSPFLLPLPPAALPPPSPSAASERGLTT